MRMMQLAGWCSGEKMANKTEGVGMMQLEGGCNELMLRSYLWEQ